MFVTFFPDAVNSLRFDRETCSGFDDCVVHAFPGVTIERLTSKLKRQPNLVRNAVFVLIHVGTNDVFGHTRSPAIIRQQFELLVEQIISIVPNACILIRSILPLLRDFDKTNYNWFIRALVFLGEVMCDMRMPHAKALVKQAKGHNGYFGCDTYTQRSTWLSKATLMAFLYKHKMCNPGQPCIMMFRIQRLGIIIIFRSVFYHGALS